MFNLKTTAPVTQISSYTAPESFSSRSAIFTLSVQDNRDVTWQCRITLNSGTWDGGLVYGLTTVPAAGATGSTSWQACTDPQV